MQICNHLSVFGAWNGIQESQILIFLFYPVLCKHITKCIFYHLVVVGLCIGWHHTAQFTLLQIFLLKTQMNWWFMYDFIGWNLVIFLF